MTLTRPVPLQLTAAATFEDLALLVPLDYLVEEQRDIPLTHGVVVRFFGPMTGRLELRVSERVPRAVAANMLGLDDPTEQLQRDAFGELANVLTGNLLSLMTHAVGVFHLRPPTPIGPDMSADVPAAETALGLEEGRANVRLFITLGG
jgi:CheY-specific phosphatase CheX